MSFYRTIADKAGLILLWIAILLFFGTIFLVVLAQQEAAVASAGFGASEGRVEIAGYLQALIQGLNSAVWPLMGAGIIHALQRRDRGNTFE